MPGSDDRRNPGRAQVEFSECAQTRPRRRSNPTSKRTLEKAAAAIRPVALRVDLGSDQGLSGLWAAPWRRQAGAMSEHITDTPNVKRLERSSQSKVIAGVCGGLGRYFDINPTVFRLAFVVLTVLGGAGHPRLHRRRPGHARRGRGRLDRRAGARGAQRPPGEARRPRARGRRDPRPARRARAPGRAPAPAGCSSSWPASSSCGRARSGAARRIAVVALITLAAIVLASRSRRSSTAFSWFDVSLGDGVGDGPTPRRRRPT